MKVPFTWKVTGWFMVGWTAEFEVGDVKPLRYFGEDLVAYRDEAGELHVMSAHCRHLGASLAHGGKVGRRLCRMSVPWLAMGPRRLQHVHSLSARTPQSGPEAAGVPGSRAERVRLRLAPSRGRRAPVAGARHVRKVRGVRGNGNDYYRPFPEFSRIAENEPVHPQIVAENGPDSAHFFYVHGATVRPICLNWEVVDEEWRFLTGWPDTSGEDPDKMALVIHSHYSGLGFAFSAFEGAAKYRLIFACTPVEEGKSNLFCSIWWPKQDGDTSDIPPGDVKAYVEKRYLRTIWEDLDIWRYQEYIEHPALSKEDAKPYMALRKWASQFYAVPADDVNALV
jgi:3-ketosteroid 9alpha-monooxygenase subunit A